MSVTPAAADPPRWFRGSSTAFLSSEAGKKNGLGKSRVKTQRITFNALENSGGARANRFRIRDTDADVTTREPSVGIGVVQGVSDLPQGANVFLSYVRSSYDRSEVSLFYVTVRFHFKTYPSSSSTTAANCHHSGSLHSSSTVPRFIRPQCFLSMCEFLIRIFKQFTSLSISFTQQSLVEVI
ncbi:hypothetical protein E2C01_056575 [Portunus trituberculatus]|uniref:Uncharacterized protein n=1 Tax=Portunus trituberculatus TaxID=210409 RepID=A0A5B7GR59_PORTR|nr:hypothetical protein [Portunus trituberculatus]